MTNQHKNIFLCSRHGDGKGLHKDLCFIMDTEHISIHKYENESMVGRSSRKRVNLLPQCVIDVPLFLTSLTYLNIYKYIHADSPPNFNNSIYRVTRVNCVTSDVAMCYINILTFFTDIDVFSDVDIMSFTLTN